MKRNVDALAEVKKKMQRGKYNSNTILKLIPLSQSDSQRK